MLFESHSAESLCIQVASYHWASATDISNDKRLTVPNLKGLLVIPKFPVTKSEPKQGSVYGDVVERCRKLDDGH